MGWIRRLFGGAREVPVEEPAPASRREALRREREKANPPPPRRRVWGIRRDVLDLICEASRAQHPREFGATLRAEKGIVTELVLTPGTLAGDRHTFINTHLLPIDASIVGTVHSHPGPYAIPSDADRQVFNGFGHTHIIIAEPYTHATWIAYDQNAEEIELDVVDD